MSFRSRLKTVLMSIPEVGTNYVIELDTEEEIDVMTVKVEVHSDFFLGDVKGLKALQQKITTALTQRGPVYAESHIS